MKKIGKYEIIQELGKGGMGVVYKARDPIISRTVAIKVILEKALEVDEVKERFYREAQTAGNLNHENITVVYDMGEEDGQPYIVMEYLEGTELRDIIRDRKEVKLAQKLEYAIQMCKGLQKAHDHDIVHRDIKPENIQVLKDGKIKIMDFGIARPVSSTLTMTGMTIGTPYYMSPEQLKGIKVNKTSDIFSFGAVFYELLTYKRPFDGASIESVMYKILQEEPEELQFEEVVLEDVQAILSKCLAKKPEERYSDFNKVVVDLNKVLGKIHTQGISISNQDLLGTVPLKSRKKVAKPAVAKKPNRFPLIFATIIFVATAAGAWFWMQPSPEVTEIATTTEAAEPPAALQKLKSDIANLENESEDINAASYARGSFDLARKMKNEAAEAETRGNYSAAESLLTISVSKFQESIQIASDEIEEQKAKAANAKMESEKVASKTPAFTEKRVEPDRPTVDPVAKAEAFSLQKSVQDKRAKVDAAGANVAALEAYKYAFEIESRGGAAIKKNSFKQANTFFNNAISGYERALMEKSAQDKARQLFEAGDYKGGLNALKAVFEGAPYSGTNQKALDLQSNIKVAISSRENKIRDINNYFNSGELRAALVAINSLPDRDKQSVEIQNLSKKIVKSDTSPPVIEHAPEKNYKPGEPLVVRSQVQDNLAVDKVTLHYQRKGTDTFSQIVMKPGDNKNMFTAQVPESYHKGREIRYYITAKDSNGNKKASGSNKKPYKIKSEQKQFEVPNI